MALMNFFNRFPVSKQLSVLLVVLLLGAEGGWAAFGSRQLLLQQRQTAVGSSETAACHEDCRTAKAECCSTGDEVACRTRCARSGFHCGQRCGPRMPTCYAQCFEGFFDCMTDCSEADASRQLKASCNRDCVSRYMGFRGCLMACGRRTREATKGLFY
ncbi:hypothetical protein BOX15_Mlig013265g1 [Macrostomum lignano]|uniref:VDE lipocalin domain-containing protein n=2 Tax=Macrostomum lignano TaxID=282301 RepID=A0A267FFS2_9PLAT|nr:hypothetical protein BOX15_Mlig013265g1 [Macrostomum lignano]